ncbi:expressed unknown protein [Seminavis robusta]|uniref:Sulfotransferase n=1 Tax=Seminavis robusta TaxID=568900 RepID=A0A9N8DXK8_9STRA|nr:expressed unknown protein [Seminavis robusta]|eukprot:Sro357_g125480.1 n/a (545) ;mRNA; f:1488-3122
MSTTFRVVCAVIGLCVLLQLLVMTRIEETVSILERSMLERSNEELSSLVAIPSTPVTFDQSKPLFVLSLPNHHSLAIPRYFECAGYNDTTMGRYWMPVPKNPRRKRMTTGQCLRAKIESKGKSDCGDYHVWMNTQYLRGPRLNPKIFRRHDCFDLVMFDSALEELASNAYSRGGTILNFVRDPKEWAESLSPQLPQYWHEWCNDSHNHTFPGMGEYDNQQHLHHFYLKYQHRLLKFAAMNPDWNYVEIDLRRSRDEVGFQLQQQLGFDKKCWLESTSGSIVGDDPMVLANQPRPNDITFPALVTAMPKSGTTTMHEYFVCGMGDWTSSHQFTWTTHEAKRPVTQLSIGECMLDNINDNTYPLLKGCGNSLVFSDTGALRLENKTRNQDSICYYPMVHLHSLERFYRSYPEGTIIHIVRNATSWISSVRRFHRLDKRWVKGYNCRGGGFPEDVKTSDEEWGEFYDGVTEIVRSFAKSHPSLTYMEIPLSEQAEPMLYDAFRFPRNCWGKSNVNTGEARRRKKRPPTSSTTAQNATVAENILPRNE